MSFEGGPRGNGDSMLFTWKLRNFNSHFHPFYNVIKCPAQYWPNDYLFGLYFRPSILELFTATEVNMGVCVHLIAVVAQ